MTLGSAPWLSAFPNLPRLGRKLHSASFSSGNPSCCGHAVLEQQDMVCCISLSPAQPLGCSTAASPLPRLALPRFWLLGSAHDSGSCLIPEFQCSLFHAAALSWSLQARRGQRVQAGEGECQTSCTGWCVLGALTPKLFCFFSLSPPLLSLLVFPFLLPLSPAAMNPLLKSCLTHQDLPTSPRCLARRPAWLIPCSRNCPVPADAGSRALVPCSHCHRGPLSVALAR